MHRIPRKPLRVSTGDWEDGPPTTQPCPIALAFEDSVDKFKEFYVALGSKDCNVANQLSISHVGDEYGRLGVWGRNAGADRRGRGSLDDILRNDSNLKSIILDILEDLCEDLVIATLVAERRESPATSQRREYRDDSDSDSLSSSNSGTDISSTTGTIYPQKQRGELSRIFSLVFERIQSLYKVSALLRRPKVQEKYIRSVAKVSDGQRALHFSEWDQAHVAEKMWQWALDLDMRYESRIDGTNYMCARAAAANVRRREQLSYWQKHPDVAEIPKQAPQENFMDQQQQGTQPLEMRVLPSAGLVIIAEPNVPNLPEPSQKTVQSFSTVAQSVLNDNETFSGRPKTIYAPSTVGPSHGARVPNPPDQPEGAISFECPYCLTKLNLKSMQQRQLWKKHVFRDLRPYICTFEDCSNPEQMYVTRHDWLYHEMQMHRRRWVCSGECDLSFSTRDAIELHMKETHAGTFIDLQLPIIIDICGRPADPNENTLCPLCPAEMTLSRLQTHLAAHLEELALFVLPVYMSDKSQKTRSNQVNGGNSDSNGMEDLPSLGSLLATGEESILSHADIKPENVLVINDKFAPKLATNEAPGYSVSDLIQALAHIKKLYDAFCNEHTSSAVQLSELADDIEQFRTNLKQHKEIIEQRGLEYTGYKAVERTLMQCTDLLDDYRAVVVDRRRKSIIGAFKTPKLAYEQDKIERLRNQIARHESSIIIVSLNIVLSESSNHNHDNKQSPLIIQDGFRTAARISDLVNDKSNAENSLAEVQIWLGKSGETPRPALVASGGTPYVPPKQPGPQTSDSVAPSSPHDENFLTAL